MLHIFNQREIDITTKKGTAVALGKFDGFHLGHRLLTDEVLRLQGEGYTGVVFTFDIRENSVIRVADTQNILTPEEKCKVAEQLGIDVLIEYPFDDAFASMEPEIFISELLVKQLHVRYVVVGSDFRFGRKKSGDVSLLNQLSAAYGYQVIVMEKMKIDGITVSSTYIRSLICESNMEKTGAFLGRPYMVSGHVVHGREFGRTIGIPTANLLPKRAKIYPRAGVYAARILLQDGACYMGITNIGDNPTVNKDRRVTIETHLFSFDGDLYEQEITVELLAFLRGEQRFSDMNALKEQMLCDIKRAKKIMSSKMS